MPWSPTSWNRRMPCFRQNSRIVWCIFAISGVGGGTQWSSVTTIFSGSQTFIVPISLNGSRAIASISCMYSRSTPPSMIWPGRTDSAWLARARTFSDIVWPVIGIGGCTGAARPINMAMDGPKVLRDRRNARADGHEFHAQRGIRHALPHLGLDLARDPNRPRRRAAVLVRVLAVRGRIDRPRAPRRRLPIEVAAEPDRMGARRIRRDRPVHRGLRVDLLGREQRSPERLVGHPVRDVPSSDRLGGERVPEGGALDPPETPGDRRGLRRRRPHLPQPARDRGSGAGVPDVVDCPRRDVRRVCDGGGETVGPRYGAYQFQCRVHGGRRSGLGWRLPHRPRAVGRADMAQGLGAILYLAIAGSVVTFVAWQWLLKEMQATFLSYIALVIPIVAVLLGASLGNETFDVIDLAGAGIVLLGIYVSTSRRAAAFARAAMGQGMADTDPVDPPPRKT